MDEQTRALYQQLALELQERMERDPFLSIAMRRCRAGKGTLQDTAQCSERASELLGQVLSEHVTDMPEGMREAVCKALLRER